MAKKRVAVLISGRGSNMASLIEAAKEHTYPAEIAVVVSNQPDAPGLARAQAQAIPTALVDHRPHGKDRGKPTTSVVRKLLNRGLAVTDKRRGAWQNHVTRMQTGS